MAYPSQNMNTEKKQESGIATPVKAPGPRMRVTAPSAMGGAPTTTADTPTTKPINEVWKDTTINSVGMSTYAPQPGISLEEFTAENKPAVQALAETLRQRLASADGDDPFWKRVSMSPEAVAASLLRRQHMTMRVVREGRTDSYSDPSMEALRSNDLYQHYRWAGGH